jgi:hypothetical protein
VTPRALWVTLRAPALAGSGVPSLVVLSVKPRLHEPTVRHTPSGFCPQRSCCTTGELWPMQSTISRAVSVSWTHHGLGSQGGHRRDSSGNATSMPGSPLVRGSAWAGGRDHTPSRVPQRWGTTSCREAAPLPYLPERPPACAPPAPRSPAAPQRRPAACAPAPDLWKRVTCVS